MELEGSSRREYMLFVVINKTVVSLVDIKQRIQLSHKNLGDLKESHF
jgi:hypothetical protein